MKKLLFIILLPVMVSAQDGVVFETVEDFMNGVRNQTNNTSNQVSNAQLVELCARAILYTAETVGGVESQKMVNTVAGEPFVALPVGIVQILHATLIRDQMTVPIKAWYPEFNEERGIGVDFKEGSGDPEDEFPLVYNYWSDTIQLSPTPSVTDDSLYLKCYIRHDSITIADTATQAIELLPGFAEAALYYACAIRELKVRNFQISQIYFALFEKQKSELISTYRRKFNVLPQGQ